MTGAAAIFPRFQTCVPRRIVKSVSQNKSVAYVRYTFVLLHTLPSQCTN